jgi:biofilm PGA synthesis N-glycosyltransferase PgaC
MIDKRHKITLVVPAFNEAEHILETMASVDAQTMMPDRRIIMCDRCTDHTPELARSVPGWEVWESVDNKGKKGGALNQAWARIREDMADSDYLVTMDADTELHPDFVENAYTKFQAPRHPKARNKLGGICANFTGTELDTALGALQMMEYARAEQISRSRRGMVPVLAGAATMFSIEGLRAVYASRGRLFQPMLTEDYELTLALRMAGYDTMAPRSCKAYTELMPTMRELWAQRLRWYRGAFESLGHYGWKRPIMSDILWIGFSLWAAATRWLFLLTLVLILLLVGHMNFSPWLLLLFVFASVIRMAGVRELGWRYVLLAGIMVEELYYAFFLEIVLWRAVFLAFFSRREGSWE